MIRTKKASNLIEHNDDEGELIYLVDKKNKTIEYFVKQDKNPRSRQLEKIYIDGFDKLPSGFYSNGFGITSGGYLLTNHLFDTLKDFTLFVSKDSSSKIIKKGKSHLVTLKYDDLHMFQERYREIKKFRNEEHENAAKYYLNRFFPRHFAETEEVDESVYKEDQIADILKKVDLMENLSKNDAVALTEFYPSFMEVVGEKLTGKKKFIQISKNKDNTEIIYLESIIKEFEKKLGQNLMESKWQDFLRDYILLFNTSYASFIEKESISLAGKYPDFMLIDVYSFIDIYEIKKPTTNLLKKDESRNNYFWDTELSKAISQTENYIHQINKNSYGFKEEVKKSKGIDIRIVKPRGFIIAGQSSQLDNEIKEENFRLLNTSLKNVEIILYDDLLASLRNFLARLKEK